MNPCALQNWVKRGYADYAYGLSVAFVDAYPATSSSLAELAQAGVDRPKDTEVTRS